MTPLAAAERIAMPQGALLCKTIEPTIAHAKLVRQPTTDGLRAFVEGAVKREECRVVKSETLAEVVDVDKRSFALIQDGDGRWWTDAENLWGYFDTPAKGESVDQALKALTGGNPLGARNIGHFSSICGTDRSPIPCCHRITEPGF